MLLQPLSADLMFAVPILIFGLISGIVCVVIWIAALINFLKTENMGDDRVVWAIILVFTGIIGAILWYWIGKPKFQGKY